MGPDLELSWRDLVVVDEAGQQVIRHHHHLACILTHTHTKHSHMRTLQTRCAVMRVLSVEPWLHDVERASVS